MTVGPAVASKRTLDYRSVGPAHPGDRLDDDRACTREADGGPPRRHGGQLVDAQGAVALGRPRHRRASWPACPAPAGAVVLAVQLGKAFEEAQVAHPAGEDFDVRGVPELPHPLFAPAALPLRPAL